jgi:hypothetical protein
MKHMTKAHLMEVCNQKQITVPSTAKKADIIALIEGAKPVAEQGRTFKGEY